MVDLSPVALPNPDTRQRDGYRAPYRVLTFNPANVPANGFFTQELPQGTAVVIAEPGQGAFGWQIGWSQTNDTITVVEGDNYPAGFDNTALPRITLTPGTGTLKISLWDARSGKVQAQRAKDQAIRQWFAIGNKTVVANGLGLVFGTPQSGRGWSQLDVTGAIAAGSVTTASAGRLQLWLVPYDSAGNPVWPTTTQTGADVLLDTTATIPGTLASVLGCRMTNGTGLSSASGGSVTTGIWARSGSEVPLFYDVAYNVVGWNSVSVFIEVKARP